MINYYISTDKDYSMGHGIHQEDCNHMPLIKNRIYLGSFYNCRQAMRLTKLTFQNCYPCEFCMSDCNEQ